MIRSLVAVALLAMNAPPPAPADFTICAPVNNGPIERPDHYGMPYQRKPDLA